MRYTIAEQAALLAIGLDAGCYRDVQAIIVHPTTAVLNGPRAAEAHQSLQEYLRNRGVHASRTMEAPAVGGPRDGPVRHRRRGGPEPVAPVQERGVPNSLFDLLHHRGDFVELLGRPPEQRLEIPAV
jgi:hypothetical protein